MRTHRIAALDLGTNTFLCLIADVEKLPDNSVVIRQVIRDEVRIVRLGQGVDATKALSPEALLRADACFKEFSRFIKEADVEKVVAVATSATRDASNGQELVRIAAGYGIPIQVISGEREAELTFLGAIEPHWRGLTAVIDVGGGSTEVIIGDQNGILIRFSADVGSVRLTEKFITKHPIPPIEFEKLEYWVRRKLFDGLRFSLEQFNARVGHSKSGLFQPEAPLNVDELRLRIENFVAVAGTPTTLAAVVLGEPFKAESVHGFRLPLPELTRLITDLAAKSIEQRQAMGGMEPKRADVIVAGAVCLKEAAQLLGSKELEVSIRGLRYGVLKDLV